jgi:hypothetical protein
LRALERRYPQIYDSTKKLAIDVDDIKVEKMDFARCIQSMVPSTHRLKPAFILPLPRSLVPLLGGTLEKIMATLKIEFPIAKLQNTPASEQENNSLTHGTHSLLQCFRPRLLITSELVNNGTSNFKSFFWMMERTLCKTRPKPTSQRSVK